MNLQPEGSWSAAILCRFVRRRGFESARGLAQSQALARGRVRFGAGGERERSSLHLFRLARLLAVLASGSTLPPGELYGATTINASNHCAWGANLGWMEARGDVASGAVVGEYICSGFIYGANVGWINLGNGSPANGIRYQNSSATDFGVNHDGLGNLRGAAWGANIGWINFEATGGPQVDLASGKLCGYAYSANGGWISLSNAQAQVQTVSLAAGADSDGDGMADAWELTHTNTLTAFTAATDTDRDGLPDRQEALADTNPLDAADKLRITSYTHSGTYNTIGWTSKATRFYAVQGKPYLGSNWVDYVIMPALGADNVGFDRTSSTDFYRIRAFRPLLP